MNGERRAWTASRRLQQRERIPTTAPVRFPPCISGPPLWRVAPFPTVFSPPNRACPRSRPAGPAGSYKSRDSDISQQQSANLDAQDAEKRVSLEVRRYDLSGGKDSPVSSFRAKEDLLLPAVPGSMSGTPCGEDLGSMSSAKSDMVPAPAPMWLTMEKGPVPAPCRQKAGVVDDIIRGHIDNGEDPALGAYVLAWVRARSARDMRLIPKVVLRHCVSFCLVLTPSRSYP